MLRCAAENVNAKSSAADPDRDVLEVNAMGYESTVALNVQRSWRGEIERDSESECVALKRMCVVQLLQNSAGVSNE
ncbi:hypothetical protein EVAR_77403_1 [Eumeta japonica]|uniref:Uncharacterized protein n=1 Tax=Eumeta variegata TaxID=151549 RepID=A0A4C1UYL9_EUMVA|nr:hypothetical protein EVAR_77403_1 [Eumeta japonica]